MKIIESKTVTINASWIVATILFIIGISIGVLLTPCQECQQSQQTACLTTTDLNYQHLNTIISLSRFCEGLGLQSAVYPQQDDQNNFYGLPICLPGGQQ